MYSSMESRACLVDQQVYELIRGNNSTDDRRNAAHIRLGSPGLLRAVGALTREPTARECTILAGIALSPCAWRSTWPRGKLNCGVLTIQMDPCLARVGDADLVPTSLRILRLVIRRSMALRQRATGLLIWSADCNEGAVGGRAGSVVICGDEAVD
jgi:hypothetical protein